MEPLVREIKHFLPKEPLGPMEPQDPIKPRVPGNTGSNETTEFEKNTRFHGTRMCPMDVN